MVEVVVVVAAEAVSVVDFVVFVCGLVVSGTETSVFAAVVVVVSVV